MKIDRLLSITLMLINRPLVTARELSEKYDVTIRTIYRDIETIMAAGIPVVAYQGKKGGFCLMDNYRIDRQLLTLNDMTAILLALKGLNTTLNNSDVDEAIEKIESIVPADQKNHMQQQFENVVIDLGGWRETPESRKRVQIINRAVSERKLLSFSYRNLLGEETDRCIEPMTLILKTHCWYVFGYCRYKKDYRLFRLSRMQKCEILKELFVKKNKVYDESEYIRMSKSKEVAITLRFSPEAKNQVEEFFHESIESVTDDGYIIIKLSYPEDEWVYSMILGYGNYVEVIAPLHIREIIADRLRRSLKNYDNNWNCKNV